MTQTSFGMQVPDLLALPVACDLVTAGRALGLGRTKTYELAQRGEFPVPLLRLGNTYRVRRADLLTLLGIEQHSDGAGVAAPAPSIENTHSNH